MRKRAGLDFGDLDDFKPKEPKPAVKEVAKKIAQEEGFTSRQPAKPKIDGRSLRATGRNAQLNMAVKQETKDRFWQMAQEEGFSTGEDFLIDLMNK